MYLLDTDVLSLTNVANEHSSDQIAAWRAWVTSHQNELFLSAITVMEVRFGIEKARAKGATRKAETLRQWLAAAETAYRGRVLPVTIEIAHKAGELLWTAVASGSSPGSEDALIAATAAVNDFTVLARNGKQLRALDAAWLDPLKAGLPSD